MNNRLWQLHNQPLLPQDHVNYLHKMKQMGREPKVIYDIGSCVLHWTNRAKEVWPDAKFYLFEAMDEVAEIYDYFEYDYELGAFSDIDGKNIDFFQNTYHPGGNSYYRENPEYSDGASILFTDNHIVKKISKTIDTVVENRGFMLPDLIKMDVQGCELDIMKGMEKCLENASDLIVEMQKVEYNKGAPMVNETMDYVISKGFNLKGYRFSNSRQEAPDSDYHFTKG